MTPELLSRLMRFPNFPDTARELVAVCGLEAAAALMAEWPGLEFPMPSVEGGGNQAGERRWAQLAEVVGEEAASRMMQRYRGCRLYIPNLKGAQTAASKEAADKEYQCLVTMYRYTHDQAIHEIALKFGMTSRSVERWLE
ncbi:MAG: hypothetical protein FWH15_06415 [Betaproteobacteria bacterium]|nr:hypothetical protein [Betaproteobacteria bacterium]